MTGLESQLPGFAVSAFTLVGFWQAGGKRRRGWAIAAVSEIAWMPYAVWLHQYGLIVTNVVFLAMFCRNWWRWKPEPAAPSVVDSAQLFEPYRDLLAEHFHAHATGRFGPAADLVIIDDPVGEMTPEQRGAAFEWYDRVYRRDALLGATGSVIPVDPKVTWSEGYDFLASGEADDGR